MDRSAQSLEQALSRITEQELSRNERYGHLVLALFSAGLAVAVASLMVTEPNLPLRTMLAFSVLVVIGLAWAAFGFAVLMRRRPLLANREIVAGRMSVAFSAVFTAGAMLVGKTVGAHPLTPAAWMGLTMTAIAVALLARAHARRAGLRALRARLEAELAAAR